MRRAIGLFVLTRHACRGMSTLTSRKGVTLLGQEAAIALDVDLMESPGFSIDQLMELAGLSVACAVRDAYPAADGILIVAGPGNNGGDGLVAARHLWHFGARNVRVVYPKRPSDEILRDLERTSTPLVSVDTPSGWHVEDGPTGPVKLAPDVLVSLTAPKKCASHFAGRHYVGGRFVPPRVAEKYGLELPPYPGASQILELPNWGS
jgi:NAD(P)H-hydrate epimerase